MAILINKHLEFRCIREDRDDTGQILLVLAEIQSQRVIIANV